MKFSVIIPAYKAEGCLTRAVESVQTQTLQDFEIIIVDDASPDGTRALAEQLAAQDTRIRVLSLPQNGGPSAARNAGFAAAKGEWLAILDADDAFLPERFEKLLVRAEAEQLDVLADNILLYDEGSGEIIGSGIQNASGLMKLDIKTFFENMVPGSRFQYGLIKPIVRASFFKEHGFKYEKNIRFGEDVVLYASYLMHTEKFWLLTEGFYVYTLPVNLKKGGASSFTQTKLNAHELISGALFFVNKYQNKLSAEQLKIILNRNTLLLRQQAARDFTGYLKKRDLLNAIKVFLKTPMLLLHCLKILKKRLGA